MKVYSPRWLEHTVKGDIVFADVSLNRPKTEALADKFLVVLCGGEVNCSVA